MIDPRLAGNPTFIRYLRIYRILLFSAIVAFAVPLLTQWRTLTPCFQREGAVVLITFLFWSLRGCNEFAYFMEVFQFFSIFMLTQNLNLAELEVNKTCLRANNTMAKFVSGFYYFFFGYYAGSMLGLICLIAAFVIYTCYQRFYVRPRIERERGVRGKEFDSLRKVKFALANLRTSSDQITCPICLVDFEEEEEVIKLPVCDHYFHKLCLKTWLQSRRDCPYCRADIKTNMKLQQSMGVNAQVQNIIVNTGQNIELEERSRRMPEEDPAQRYVEMAET